MIEGGIPLFGSLDVFVDGVNTVSIHDDIYYDLVVRILPPEEEGDNDGDGDESGEVDVDAAGAVQVGDWQVRQPSYQVRVPNHLCTERIPSVGDCLAIMFIAQQASAVEYLNDA